MSTSILPVIVESRIKVMLNKGDGKLPKPPLGMMKVLAIVVPFCITFDITILIFCQHISLYVLIYR